jgi:tetratricopeptide (TPR) repeat protein
MAPGPIGAQSGADPFLSVLPQMRPAAPKLTPRTRSSRVAVKPIRPGADADTDEPIGPDADAEPVEPIRPGADADPGYAAYAQATRLAQVNQWDAAIAQMDLAIKANSKLALYYKVRGHLRFSKGDYDHAIDDYERAIDRDPNDVESYQYRGFSQVYYKQRYSRAIKDFDQAIRLRPNEAENYKNRGIIRIYDKQDANLSIADFNMALQLNPRDVEVYRLRGGLLHNIRQYDMAIQDYDQVLRANPRDAEILRNRGLALARLGQNDRR